MTTYLCFNDRAQAEAALAEAGIPVDDGEIGHPDVYWAGQGGVIWGSDGQNITGIHVNVEAACPAALQAYAIPAPVTPFTVRW